MNIIDIVGGFIIDAIDDAVEFVVDNPEILIPGVVALAIITDRAKQK